MVRRILKYIVYGVAWGWCWFVAACLIIDLTALDATSNIIFEHFSQNVLASAIIGIGFGTSSIVYTFEQLRRWQQVSIHFCVGMGIFFPVAFGLKWFPSASALMVISCVVVAVLVFASIWSCFYFYYRHEAKKINERLRKQERDRE